MAIRKIYPDKVHNDDYPTSYPEDVDRLVRVMKENGYESSKESAEEVWSDHSDSMCAGWLFLPDSDILLWTYIAEMVKTRALL